jgi:hypothetical protein
MAHAMSSLEIHGGGQLIFPPFSAAPDAPSNIEPGSGGPPHQRMHASFARSLLGTLDRRTVAAYRQIGVSATRLLVNEAVLFTTPIFASAVLQ